MQESPEANSLPKTPEFPKIDIDYELTPGQVPFIQIDGQQLGKVTFTRSKTL